MENKEIGISSRGKGVVRVFACGGAGTNIGMQLEKHRGSKETGFAELDIVYLDTSKSNLRSSIKPEHCYIIDGLDGSGKIRAENHPEISERIKAILQKFKPGDLNVVISSGGGGSGSVFGPLLTKELLKNEVPVVTLMVGSTDTLLDCKNTLKTIKSYESIAKTSKAPVVMRYIQNSEDMPRKEADAYMLNTIIALAVLYSRENREVDSRDLHNWLQFHRVTTFPIQLASLTLCPEEKDLQDIGNIISVATLVKDGMTTALSEMPEYQCCGFLPEDIDEGVDTRMPMHYVVSDGIIPAAAKHLEKIIEELKASQEARGKSQSVISNSDIIEEDGLVL